MNSETTARQGNPAPRPALRKAADAGVHPALPAVGNSAPEDVEPEVVEPDSAADPPHTTTTLRPPMVEPYVAQTSDLPATSTQASAGPALPIRPSELLPSPPVPGMQRVVLRRERFALAGVSTSDSIWGKRKGKKTRPDSETADDGRPTGKKVKKDAKTDGKATGKGKHKDTTKHPKKGPAETGVVAVVEEVLVEPTVELTVSLPRSLHRALGVRATQLSVPPEDVVAALITEWLLGGLEQ